MVGLAKCRVAHREAQEKLPMPAKKPMFQDVGAVKKLPFGKENVAWNAQKMRIAFRAISALTISVLSMKKNIEIVGGAFVKPVMKMVCMKIFWMIKVVKWRD